MAQQALRFARSRFIPKGFLHQGLYFPRLIRNPISSLFVQFSGPYQKSGAKIFRLPLNRMFSGVGRLSVSIAFVMTIALTSQTSAENQPSESSTSTLTSTSLSADNREKSYVCKTCGKGFHNFATYKHHVVDHTVPSELMHVAPGTFFDSADFCPSMMRANVRGNFFPEHQRRVEFEAKSMVRNQAENAIFVIERFRRLDNPKIKVTKILDLDLERIGDTTDQKEYYQKVKKECAQQNKIQSEQRGQEHEEHYHQDQSHNREMNKAELKLRRQLELQLEKERRLREKEQQQEQHLEQQKMNIVEKVYEKQERIRKREEKQEKKRIQILSSLQEKVIEKEKKTQSIKQVLQTNVTYTQSIIFNHVFQMDVQR